MSPIRGDSKFIYLAEAQNGLVKIGVSSWPVSRVAAINLHSPIACRLIAMWPGYTDDERALHRRFAAFRRHNEWFVMHGEMLAFVDANRGVGVSVGPWPDCTPGDHLSRAERTSKRLSELAKTSWARRRHEAAQCSALFERAQ